MKENFWRPVAQNIIAGIILTLVLSLLLDKKIDALQQKLSDSSIEILVGGIVTNEESDGIPNVHVFIEGLGNTTTDDMGNFSFVIKAPAEMDNFRVQTIHDHFERKEVPVYRDQENPRSCIPKQIILHPKHS